MNKREVELAVKAGQAITIPQDAIEDLKAKYEMDMDALQEKIDRLEGMNELGETLQERLDGYNERMTALEHETEALQNMIDAYEELGSAIEDLEGTI